MNIESRYKVIKLQKNTNLVGNGCQYVFIHSLTVSDS